jgi:hypothetical protein
MSFDAAVLRANKRFARQDYDKQVMQNAGPASSSYDDAGPPVWSRQAWESFRAQYGFYPFGHQGAQGGYINPPTFAGAPDWVYELMGLRKPPVTVSPDAA